MNFYLKILNEVKSSRHLKVNGTSGILYLFKWSDEIRAYVYHPKNQEEVEDLVKTMGRTTSAIFAPVNLPAKALATEAFSAPVEVAASEKKPLDPALTEHCLVRGIIVSDEDDDDLAKRLLGAYEKGFVSGGCSYERIVVI